jgi:antitoxin HigA-1
MTNRMRPIHPGEILRDELDTLGLSANAFARALDVPTNRITGIIKEQRSVTADTALRLAKFFGTTPDFWMSLQSSYDVKKARMVVGKEIERAVTSLKTLQAA